jgi:hypothetical protein
MYLRNAVILNLHQPARAESRLTTDDVGCLLLPTDMHVGRRAGSAMVTAVVRGGSTSTRTAIYS